MKRIILTLFAIMAISFFSKATAQSVAPMVDKQTLVYAQKNGLDLYLDKYEMKKTSAADVLKPTVIFMFGGGFTSGVKDREEYISFFNKLVEEGYVVVSIDYRLGLKNATVKQNMSQREFLELFSTAIFMAVDDLYDATSFVIDRASEWGIDRNKIILCGSSAGAISVLQAEYERNKKSIAAQKLPSDFRYAGVVSFAGAILEIGDRFNLAGWQCPVLMMHGEADSNVPYEHLSEQGAGLYGSEYIAERLEDRNVPYWFISFENAGHEVAVDPMNDNFYDILSYLDKFVMKKEKLQIESEIKLIGRGRVNDDFTINDYIRSNFQK